MPVENSKEFMDFVKSHAHKKHFWYNRVNKIGGWDLKFPLEKAVNGKYLGYLSMYASYCTSSAIPKRNHKIVFGYWTQEFKDLLEKGQIIKERNARAAELRRLIHYCKDPAVAIQKPGHFGQFGGHFIEVVLKTYNKEVGMREYYHVKYDSAVEVVLRKYRPEFFIEQKSYKSAINGRLVTMGVF
jgi:hypothetical protein